MLTKFLNAYAANPENPGLNYNLALEYENINQTASAISFFLRAADRAEDKNLAYAAMLKIGLCFEKQGNRGNSVRGAYLHALNLLPYRPEAYYFLARHYEKANDHVLGYSFAQQGLTIADFNQIPLHSFTEYKGEWMLLFQKMVSSWHWGKDKECRELLQELKKHKHNFDHAHWQAVQRNLLYVGGGTAEEVFHPYHAAEHSKLRYKFPGSETIVRNWSQVFQDMFVLSIFNGKKNGTYLEIGAGDPEWGNNTKLLEEWGWTGIGIEKNKELCIKYNKQRKNRVLEKDALKVDYFSLCKSISNNNIIDYLQLDCEPSQITYEIMRMLPFDKVKFGVITYEHDDFVDLSGQYKPLSREFLQSKGYILVVSDMSGSGRNSFEDWWVHPEVVPEINYNRMKDVGNYVKHPNNYIFS